MNDEKANPGDFISYTCTCPICEGEIWLDEDTDNEEEEQEE